eukprot:SAG31_NODE_8700_length_1403_cov_1.648773_2_plen_143_part_00
MNAICVQETLVYGNSVAVIDMPAIRTRTFPWRVWATNRGNSTSEPAPLGLQGETSSMQSLQVRISFAVTLLFVKYFADAGYGSEAGWYASTNCAAGLANKWAPGIDPWHDANAARTSHHQMEPAGYTTLVYPPRPVRLFGLQ